jgi:competence protein ComEA
MWVELWSEHRKGFLFATGMLCFLMAGLLAQLLPLHENHEKKLEPPVQSEKNIGEEAPSPKDSSSSVAANAAENQPEKEWFVYITGSVRNPGVYKLPVGSRLFHLVEAAGGMDNLADPTALNMVEPLEDGLHVHVPLKSERSSENTKVAEPPRATPPQTPSRSRSTPPKRRNGVVDINQASQEELTSLKGIGPVLAKNIIEYRQKNGRFRSVEDLLQVKGIGVKKLEGFRDSVTVGP